MVYAFLPIILSVSCNEPCSVQECRNTISSSPFCRTMLAVLERVDFATIRSRSNGIIYCLKLLPPVVWRRREGRLVCFKGSCASCCIPSGRFEICNNDNNSRCWITALKQWSDVDCCEYKMVIVIPEESRNRRVVDCLATFPFLIDLCLFKIFLSSHILSVLSVEYITDSLNSNHVCRCLKVCLVSVLCF